MAHFCAYSCGTLYFRALRVLTTCVLATSTLKKRGGAGTAFLRQKKTLFDGKKGHFSPIFGENGGFWCIRMLQNVFGRSLCPYNIVLCIYHPHNREGRSSTTCLRPNKSIFDQKTAIFSLKMANFGANTCCKMCFADLCASPTSFFTSSAPKIGERVFHWLSEAIKVYF